MNQDEGKTLSAEINARIYVLLSQSVKREGVITWSLMYQRSEEEGGHQWDKAFLLKKPNK